MSGRIKIKSKDKDKRPKIDVFKVIENRFNDWYIPSCPQMSLVYMRMVDINDILYLIGGEMFQASTEAYMTSSECNDRNYWSVSGYGQVGVSDKRNPKRIRLIRDL